MNFDSPEWRQCRDENVLRWCCGNHAAAQFLLDLNAIIETWDDLIDGDPATPDQINAAFCKAIIGLPGNPFYREHVGALLPTITLAVNAWLDANTFEKSASPHERMTAFFLRILGIDIFIQCALLTGGLDHMRAVSVEIRRFFANETYSEWEHCHEQIHPEQA